MKLKAFGLLAAFACLFIAATAEARGHSRFSVNVGTVFNSPAPCCETYVVQRPYYETVYVPPPAPVAVYPYQSVVVYPQPYYQPVYVQPARPVNQAGISFGWSWR